MNGTVCEHHNDVVQSYVDLRQETGDVKRKVTEMHEAMVGTMDKEGFVGETRRKLAAHDGILTGIQRFVWAVLGVAIALVLGAIWQLITTGRVI